MNNIPDSLKIYEVSKIWKEAAYNFVFWDKVTINWDEEYKNELIRILETKDIYDYYRELSRFVILLNDGHTRVTFPSEMYDNPEYFSVLPVILAKFDKQIAVINTSEEIKDSIPLYSILRKIDGIDVDTYIKEKCYPFIWHGNEAACNSAAMKEIMVGRGGSKHIYTFETEGKLFDVSLEKSDASKMKWVKTEYSETTDTSQTILSCSNTYKIYLKNDIAVIKINTFCDTDVPYKIYECYEELKKAKGYVVDVRDNRGGNSSNVDAVAALFIKDSFKSCFSETQMYEPTVKAYSNNRTDFHGLSLDDVNTRFANDPESIKTYRMGRNIYYVRHNGYTVYDSAPGTLTGPVVVLMNENTVSAAEDFIDVMKMYTDAVFIGNNTAGSSGQPLTESLESGGSFRICTRRCIAQNGEDIYNKGFIPDIKMAQTLEDIQSGRDAIMEKGIEVVSFLKSQI